MMLVCFLQEETGLFFFGGATTLCGSWPPPWFRISKLFRVVWQDLTLPPTQISGSPGRANLLTTIRSVALEEPKVYYYKRISVSYMKWGSEVRKSAMKLLLVTPIKNKLKGQMSIK
jgi:hypothetical protein